jgi:hypothetical protein
MGVVLKVVSPQGDTTDKLISGFNDFGPMFPTHS